MKKAQEETVEEKDESDEDLDEINQNTKFNEKIENYEEDDD